MASAAAPLETAKAAAGVLRRGVRRIAAYDVILVSFILALLIVIFFHDIVFLGRTLVTSLWQPGALGFEPPFGYLDRPVNNPYIADPLASAVGAEPTVEKIASLIRDFQFPLWNANISLGRPFLVEAASANPSPIRLPLVIWPSPEMWDAFLLARFFVAGLFTYLLAKRLGLAKPAAFGAAVAFIFSGLFILKVNMAHADFAMMVPVLLYAFELLLDRPGPGRTTFAVAAVVLGVLAANPQSAVLLLLYGSAYYLARAFAKARSNRGFRLWPGTMRLALVLAIGVGLTAFMLVPLFELSGSLGFSGLGVHRHADRGPGFDRLPSLISLFVPYFNGPPQANFQDTGWTGIRNYVGVAVPVLAFIGLWNRPAMGKTGWFFLGTAVILVAKTYGVPVVNLMGRLPVLDIIDFPQYLPPLIAFSLAMLAGLGLDQLSRGAGPRSWHPLLAVVVLTSLLGWLVWLNRGILGSIPETHLFVQFTFAGGLIVATAALVLATRRGLVPASAGMVLLVGLVAVELFAFTTPTKGEFADLARAVYGRDDVPVVERPQRYDPFTEPPYISFLREDTSKYRVIGLSGILFPNTTEAYNIDDIRGLTAVSVERYVKYIKGFIDPGVRFQWRGRGWPPLNTKGGLSLLTNNPMFDLLNVKYIITPQGSPLMYDYDLAEQFLPTKPEKGSPVRLDVFSINGEDDGVLFQHPSSSMSYTFTPSQESKFLLFRLALDPEVWDPGKGDGVLFQVSVLEGRSNKTVFSTWVDPKNNPEDRRWIDGGVDLEPYLGRPVTLVLSTSSGETNAWDWAGWGGLRLAPSRETPPEGSSSSQFDLVYDREVEVYQNRNAFLRAFIVHRATLAAGQDSAIALMKRPDFNPSTNAVVEGDLSGDQLAALEASPIADGSSAEITHYSDNRVEMLANMENPGLLVLSDTFYPGWKAYVDGKQVPIYPTDLALRSVFLPAGEHKVEFIFSPASFKLGLVITIASLLTLVLYAAWGPARRAVAGWIGRGSQGR